MSDSSGWDGTSLVPLADDRNTKGGDQAAKWVGTIGSPKPEEGVSLPFYKLRAQWGVRAIGGGRSRGGSAAQYYFYFYHFACSV